MKEPIHKNFFMVLLSGFVFFVVEFFIKNAMVAAAAKDTGAFAQLRFVPNEAMAFSIPVHNLIIVALALIMILWLLQYFAVCCRDGLYGHVWALNGIIWGAFSNVYDRISRGFVVDYVDVGLWPVFNLADVAIVVGVIALLVVISKQESKNQLQTLSA
ncbi:signal peptidase II [Candidatus Falkowbacteria bacterium]|nr:signal peptidase II [Candidatus Falkowbacteria bacterium]